MKLYARVSHSLLTSDKLAALLEHENGCAALGLWTVATTVSSRDELDGRVPLMALRFVAERDQLKQLVSILCDVGLFKIDGSHVVVVDYLEHNNSRAEIEALRKKRSRSGRLGGKQTAKQVLEQVSSKTNEFAKTSSQHPVSASASVFVLTQESEPEHVASLVPAGFGDGSRPMPLPASSPLDARIRRALSTGYARAIEARLGDMPTSHEDAEDVAISAVEHAAKRTGRDPVELALGAAVAWLDGRKSEKYPRWRYFMQDLGEVLSQAGPVSQSEGPLRGLVAAGR